jgi:UTP:GlnB (protein PII) uridylyltransferase
MGRPYGADISASTEAFSIYRPAMTPDSTSDPLAAHLQDVEIHLPDRPGALADLGEALGRAGVSLEGGGVFTHDGRAVAHYLVDDGPRAVRAVVARWESR